MEETVGLGLAASGMIGARGKEIWNELDFAFCDIAVGGAMNFILVYLLTPTIGGSVVGAGVIGKVMGRMGMLPANVFSKGAFSMTQRAGSFAYKGVLFAGCGFAGSLFGTSMSQMLIGVRRLLAKEGEGGEAKQLPNVAVNSAAWAGFMLLSSNPRYQAVAGIERGLFHFAPDTVAKIGTAVLRTGNNILGGATWVWWAKAIGLQGSSKKGTEE